MNTAARFHNYGQSAGARLKKGAAVFCACAVGDKTVLMAGRGSRRIEQNPFPQTGDQSASASDTGAEVVLALVDFPLLYNASANLNALALFENRTHGVIKTALDSPTTLAAQLELASARRDEFDERRGAQNIGVDFSRMRLMTLLQNWSLHYRATDGAGSPEAWALCDYAGNFIKIYRSQENPSYDFDSVRAALESEDGRTDFRDLIVWLDGEEAA